MGRILNPAFNEFTSGCTGKENLPVNQMVAKCTAHSLSFETGLMCSSFCRPLIFNRLKNRVHPEVNSLKQLSVYPYRGWASPTPSEEVGKSRENTTPSEGVQDRFSAKMAFQCLYRGWTISTSSEGVWKCRENATPSEGVMGTFTAKMALWCL